MHRNPYSQLYVSNGIDGRSMDFGIGDDAGLTIKVCQRKANMGNVLLLFPFIHTWVLFILTSVCDVFTKIKLLIRSLLYKLSCLLQVSLSFLIESVVFLEASYDIQATRRLRGESINTKVIHIPIHVTCHL